MADRRYSTDMIASQRPEAEAARRTLRKGVGHEAGGGRSPRRGSSMRFRERARNRGISREQVIELYKRTRFPEIEGVREDAAGPGSDAAGLLAADARRSTGRVPGRARRYPDFDGGEEAAAARRPRTRRTAEKLFERADAATTRDVAKALRESPSRATSSTYGSGGVGIRISNAEYNAALAAYRLAMIYPKGAMLQRVAPRTRKSDAR